MSERKEVKRYNVDGYGDMYDYEEGQFVEFIDYDALLSEKAALAAENERLREELTQRIGKAVPMTQWGKLVAAHDRRRDEVHHLRSAIAGAREALNAGAHSIDWLIDHCPELYTDQYRETSRSHAKHLRALSSIGDLPAGEEG